MMNKHKKLLLTLFLTGIGIWTTAQTGRTDTLPAVDSTLDELRDGILDNIPVISIDDNDMGDGAAPNVSSVLTAGRDPFFSAAAFNFSAVRFRVRGYDQDLFGTWMNGIPMENLDNGFTPFGLWGGLNDVLRNRDLSIGLRPNTFAFGDIGTNTYIDARASKQRAQTSIGYAYSNRNYRQRAMVTHSTGLNKKGWAFTLSGSRRYAEEGYVPGTYYDGYSFFAGVDKLIKQKHLLSLIVFGAPTENGRQGPSVQEMMDLAGTNYYNPSWGFQNGKVRNANVGRTNQPYAIFTHDWKIDNRTNLVTAFGYSTGYRSTTALDWYNARDPRPDYYRYLPSYYASTDPFQANLMRDRMQQDINLRQVNWDYLYTANRGNRETIQNADGTPGNNVSGLRSRYIVEERVIGSNRFNFNTVLNKNVSEHFDLTAGLNHLQMRNHYFKRVDDLLGGDFYVNLNQFAERDFPNNPSANQFDADHPNRILRQGDRFGYDYDMQVQRSAAWLQGVFKFRRIDYFLSAEGSHTSFFREGNVRTGIYPNNSLGKSAVNRFTNYALKTGLTFKIDGRNYIYANAAMLTKAPYFENIYIAPRTRDFQQQNPRSTTVRSAEAGYVLNAPKVKVRLTGYVTKMEDDYNVLSFYHDDYRNFVNYALSNIDRLHFGGELGTEVKVTSSLSVNAAAAIGRYYYTSRQEAVITLDNSNTLLGNETIYAQNFRVPATPQEAFSMGLNYRSPKFWYVSLTGNYFRQMWLDFNPIRRTSNAVDGLEYKGETFNAIIDQTSWDPQYTVDLFAGYSWKLPKKLEIDHKSTFLVFNLGVNNLLDNRNIITGGFEQLRFDFADKNPGKFPPRIFYGYGLNMFASATLRF